MHLHLYTHTHTQAHVYILQFIFLSHTRTRVHAHTLCNLYRSQRMEVRHPPQRKLRVSACSAQPNHKSCQATLVSADTHTDTQFSFTPPSFLLCGFEYKREGFGDYRGASLFSFLFRCFLQYLLYPSREKWGSRGAVNLRACACQSEYVCMSITVYACQLVFCMLVCVCVCVSVCRSALNGSQGKI